MATERQAVERLHEEDLLAAGRAVLRPLPEREPRAGFAAMVARNAFERRTPPLLGWLRWSLGGLAVAGAAAVAVFVAQPRAPAPAGDDVMVAQRLDLFEDMAVMQNQQALEDLEVVQVLDQLQEARP